MEANGIEMSNTEMILAQNPSIGIIAGIFGILTPFVSFILPVVQLALAIFSLVVVLLTLEAKWKERKLNQRRHGKK